MAPASVYIWLCERGKPKLVPTRLMTFNKAGKSNKTTRERRKIPKERKTKKCLLHIFLSELNTGRKTLHNQASLDFEFEILQDRKQGHPMQQIANYNQSGVIT